MLTNYRSRGGPICRHRSSQYTPRRLIKPSLETDGGPLTGPTYQSVAPPASHRLAGLIQSQLPLPAPTTDQPQQQLLGADPLAAQQTRPLLVKKLTSDERQQLVRENRWLAREFLAKHQTNLQRQRTRVGLAQAIQIGLIEAAETFDPDQHDQFPTYAKSIILGQIAIEQPSARP